MTDQLKPQKVMTNITTKTCKHFINMQTFLMIIADIREEQDLLEILYLKFFYVKTLLFILIEPSLATDVLLGIKNKLTILLGKK